MAQTNLQKLWRGGRVELKQFLRDHLDQQALNLLFRTKNDEDKPRQLLALEQLDQFLTEAWNMLDAQIKEEVKKDTTDHSR